jgi:tetratricopeptide (TPR) repeat protein/DNA-binding SARP family transcriptional activator
MSRVRQLLGQAAATTGETGARVERRRAGYVLTIELDLVDLHRFGRLIDQGGDPERADADRAGALAEALHLWRGQPLAALPGRWAAQVRSSWQRRRLEAAVQWAQIELRLSHPAVVIPVLHDLIDQYPLVEPLEGLLMRALHAAGRSAEALDRYTIVRKRLAEELGTDPSPPLQNLHRQILTADPALADPAQIASAAAATPHTTASVAPRQLPAPPRSFAGRTDELAHLDMLLTAHGDRQTTAALISAVSGTAGIGKTALAVHWAHRVADRFPDGQLYVNLRGFHPTRSVMDPAEAVRRFLDALGVPVQRIPVDLDEQAALYRSHLAGRRMLILLDNARDTSQVRPLLPGTPGCLVLITSRNQLTSLIAVDGARPLILGLLTHEEARQLLAGRIGADRVAVEPAAVGQIVTRCAQLPLALTLVAARAALRPHVGLHALAEELRDARQRWETLTGDEPTTDVRTVFSWSYQALTPPVARLFRLLGLHPGPDLAAPAAASLAGLPLSQVRPLLAELVRAHLVIEHAAGRYSFHDLLRAYAVEQAHVTDDDQLRRAAIRRILDHYLYTAHTAAMLYFPTRDAITLTPPQPETTPETPANYTQALSWFSTERAVLLAAVDYAAATGWEAHTWQLAWALADFLDRRGDWREYAATQQAALAAAYRLAEPSVQALVHRILARAHTVLGRLDDAHTHLQHALDLYSQCGDQTGQAQTHHNLTYAFERQGRYHDALDHGRRAQELFSAVGHRAGQAEALGTVGWIYALLGDHHQALTRCREALTMLQEHGDVIGEAAVWDSLGYAHHHLCHHTQAITCYQRAAVLYRDRSDRYHEATSLTKLGDIHGTTNNPRAAHDAWQQALTILTNLDHPDAERVRTKLARDGATTSGNPTERPEPAGLRFDK